MSGGVDSSLAAVLLSKEVDVIGIHMKLHNEKSGIAGPKACCSADAMSDIAQIAETFGFRAYAKNMVEAFDKLVITNFKDVAASGGATIPCTLCNGEFKFDLLFKQGAALGITKVATGHYAICDGSAIYMADDKDKDQSFFLWSIKRERLPNILFPLGKMTKTEVRSTAAALGVITAAKPESQDLCFAPSVKDFFAASGINFNYQVVDKSGKVLGSTSKQLIVGQKIFGQYITNVNPDLGIATASDAVATVHSINLDRMNFQQDLEDNKVYQIRVRHRGPLYDGIVSGSQILFIHPIPAVAHGQTAVIYDNEKLIGGGFIVK